MRTSVKLRPGQRGTKRWVAQYGDQLLAVRYRYDRTRHKRYTTVELIVAEARWAPATTLVGVRVAWDENELRRQVKAAGGRWDPARRVWDLPYGQIRALSLLHRIVWPD